MAGPRPAPSPRRVRRCLAFTLVVTLCAGLLSLVTQAVPAGAQAEPSFRERSFPDVTPPAPSAQVDGPPRQSLRDRVRGVPPEPRAVQINEASQDSVAVEPIPATPDHRRNQTPPASTPLAATAVPSGTSAPPLDGPLSLDVIVDLWSKIRADVKSVNRRIDALLQQVDPVTINGNVVVLASPYEFHRNRVNSDEARHVIEDVISRLGHLRVQVSCVTRDEAVAMAGTSRPAPSSPGIPLAASPEGTSTRTPEVTYATSAIEPVDATLKRDEPFDRSSTAVTADIMKSPSPESSIEDDERRIQAVRNIFDAEEEPDA